MKSQPKKNTVTFKVEWWNLEIDDFNFSFNYSVTWEYGFSKGVYSSTHSWQGNLDEFRELLEEGYAAQLAVEDAL